MNAPVESLPLLDAESIGRLYKEHSRHIFRFLARMVKSYDDVEEIVQDTFIKALRGAKNFKGESKPETWLYSIAINTARNRYRLAYNDRLTDSIDDVEMPEPETEDVMQVVERNRMLADLEVIWNELPPEQQDAMQLIVEEDVDYEGAAAILGWPVGTVKSRVYRARERFRNGMGNVVRRNGQGGVMGVNVQRMLDLIHQKPGIRTVEISDRLDCEIDELNEVLLEQASRGVIARHQVTAPNGRNATAYTIAGVMLPDANAAPVLAASPVEKAIAFILAQPDRQATGAQLHIALDLKGDEAPSKVLAEGLQDGRLVKDGKFWTVAAGAASPAIKDAVQQVVADAVKATVESISSDVVAQLGKAISGDQKEPAKAEGKTKVDQVINFLKANGKSSTDAVRKVLGIKGKVAPICYLQNAVSDGRIKKDKYSWWVPGYENGPTVAETLQAVSAPAPAVQESQPEVHATILDNEPGYINLPREAVELVREQIRREHSFACALWSDGELQLVRDGETLVTLSPEEADEVRRYLNRIAGEVAV